MTDIVKRLRSSEIQRDVAAAYICIEAANEIERLWDEAAVNRIAMEIIRDAAIWLKQKQEGSPR